MTARLAIATVGLPRRRAAGRIHCAGRDNQQIKVLSWSEGPEQVSLCSDDRKKKRSSAKVNYDRV